MNATTVMMLKKLRGPVNIVRIAASHNKRTAHKGLSERGSVDPKRTVLNVCLGGPSTPEQVAALARELMASAGVTKLRKDAVRAIEIVVSLPDRHGIDELGYFAEAVAWFGNRFGGASNVLSADVHRDEAAPHLHILVLPLVAGRMIGSDLVGGRASLTATQREFHEQVAASYGLRRPATRLKGPSKAKTATAVLEQLRKNSDAALQSALWLELREAITRDPAPFLAALGIAPIKSRPQPPRSMTAIFIGRGKGPELDESAEPYRARRVVGS